MDYISLLLLCQALLSVKGFQSNLKVPNNTFLRCLVRQPRLSNITVKNDDSDDKIYEVQFETYDEANSFKKTNAFILECADFKDKDGKTVKYQKEKKIEEEDDDQNFGSDDGGSDEESSDRGENDDESEARDEDDADDTSEI